MLNKARMGSYLCIAYAILDSQKIANQSNIDYRKGFLVGAYMMLSDKEQKYMDDEELAPNHLFLAL